MESTMPETIRAAPMRIPMRPVTSSNIAAVGYDAATSTLAVQFSNDTAYTFAGVPAETHQDLMAAKSIGAFFSAHIRGSFAGTKQEPAKPAPVVVAIDPAKPGAERTSRAPWPFPATGV
jgi:hypothetical protein